LLGWEKKTGKAFLFLSTENFKKENFKKKMRGLGCTALALLNDWVEGGEELNRSWS